MNDQVRVILTPTGETLLRARNVPLLAYHYDIKTKMLECSLWELIETFSDQFHMYNNLPFKNNEIIIMDEAEKIIEIESKVW